MKQYRITSVEINALWRWNIYSINSNDVVFDSKIERHWFLNTLVFVLNLTCESCSIKCVSNIIEFKDMQRTRNITKATFATTPHCIIIIKKGYLLTNFLTVFWHFSVKNTIEKILKRLSIRRSKTISKLH